MPEEKVTEKNRAAYYKKNLQKVKVLYEPAILLEKDELHFSDSMVGEFVLAPFLVLFSAWVLQEAMKDGIDRLYFLARDGYPAYIAAKRISEAYDLKIDCRYLYCSRYALRVPMYSENQKEMLDYICRNGIDITTRKVLKRAGLDSAQTEALVAESRDINKLDEKISNAELQKLRKRLSDNPRFLKIVCNNSENSWPTLRTYFEQEGFLEKNAIGIVDSGWIGSTQKSICDILKRMGKDMEIKGYYWGLYDIPEGMDPQEYRGFYFEKKNRLRNKIFFSNCLIETIFSSTQGTTVGYKIGKNGAEPILDGNSFNTHELTCIHTLLEKYTDNFINYNRKVSFSNLKTSRYVRLLASSLHRFMWNPTREESRIFGRLLFSDDLLDDHCKELAPVFTTRELTENHFWHRVLATLKVEDRIVHESGWYEATVRRSTDRVLIHKLSYSAYRTLSYIKKSI